MKTFIGISRDHSGSMSGLAIRATDDYNRIVRNIKSAAADQKQDTYVSVIKCGTGVGNVFETQNHHINHIKELSSSNYDTRGHSTPLYDSIGSLIEHLQTVDADSDSAFLVMAITDGEENSSCRWNSRTLSNKINQLQATGRWSFVLRVPVGYRDKMARALSIPLDNIQEWQTTNEGLKISTVQTEQAFTAFYQGRARGETSTTKFYMDTSSLTQKDVNRKLTDISGAVTLYVTSQQEVIRPFIERVTGSPYIKGAAFYQLTKAERAVQAYKKLILRDKNTGVVYGGDDARIMLGLPTTGSVAVEPNNHGNYEIFIQSTSINRVLPPNTQLMYWPLFNQPISASETKKLAVQTVAKVKATKKSTSKPKTNATNPVVNAALGNLPNKIRAKTPEPSFAAAYSAGFDFGKTRAVVDATQQSQLVQQYSQKYLDAFMAGYKDGRGKKKRLHKV